MFRLQNFRRGIVCGCLNSAWSYCSTVLLTVIPTFPPAQCPNQPRPHRENKAFNYLLRRDKNWLPLLLLRGWHRPGLPGLMVIDVSFPTALFPALLSLCKQCRLWGVGEGRRNLGKRTILVVQHSALLNCIRPLLQSNKVLSEQQHGVLIFSLSMDAVIT